MRHNEARNVVAAFSEEHVERLTGISPSQLRYWDRTKFYVPSFADENRRNPFSRIYSFKDVVALRVLHSLRNQFGVPLQHLRDVSAKLAHMGEDRWTGVKLWALNKRVIWQGPEDGVPKEVVGGQYIVPMVLDAIAADTRRDISVIGERDQDQRGRIEQSRFTLHNAPVLAGTRIPVQAIKRFAGAGYKTEEILREYPDLTEEDVKAAIAYESRTAA
jgi:uncharacterized protein (DUF433 family)